MGTEYNVRLGIGYIVDRDDFLAPFRVDVPAELHMEDRYDVKTGEKLEPVKVVDVEAREEYEYKGERYKEEYEFSLALERDFSCYVEDNDSETVRVTLRVPTDDSSFDVGRLTVGGAATFDDVTALRAALKMLHKNFKKLGIDLGVAKVFPALDIS